MTDSVVRIKDSGKVLLLTEEKGDGVSKLFLKSEDGQEVEVRPTQGLTSSIILVSSDGRLISLRTKKILKQNSVNGYASHVTRVGGRTGKNVVIKTHLAVAKAFLPNPANKPEINHRDGNKMRPALDNLEWSTRIENVQHAYKTGLAGGVDGSPGAAATIPMETITKIRQEHAVGPEWSLRSKAKELGISHATLLKILRGERY
jgi:hypothetical protein